MGQEEIIGKRVTIKEATNKEIEGRSGKVLLETKNTITIEEDGKEKRYVKSHIISLKVYDHEENKKHRC